MKEIAIISLTIFLTIPGLSNAAEGWQELPGTHIRDVCPPNAPVYNFYNRCANVVIAWSGGTLDTKRNRLVIFGGGHGDYRGNELYGLDLNTFTMERLTDPSTAKEIADDICEDKLPDGTPSSRHSYGGLAYIAHADRLFVYGGSKGCGSGGFGNDTWTFDFNTNTWHYMQPSGDNPGRALVASAYDPVTKKVFMRTNRYLYAYDFDNNSWERLSGDDLISGFSFKSAAIDPVRRKFVIVGGKSAGSVHVIDLSPGSNYQQTQLTTTGDTTMVQGKSPGVAYDPVNDRIVAWDGARESTPPIDTVYALNLDTLIWSAHTFPNGPTQDVTTGTFGRFAYVPSLQAIVAVSSVDENAFLLRLGDGSGNSGFAVAPDEPSNLTAE